MHTRAAEYTTFITFELINRKSGGKATRIAVLRKLREEKKKKTAPSMFSFIQDKEKEGKIKSNDCNQEGGSQFS